MGWNGTGFGPAGRLEWAADGAARAQSLRAGRVALVARAVVGQHRDDSPAAPEPPRRRHAPATLIAVEPPRHSPSCLSRSKMYGSASASLHAAALACDAEVGRLPALRIDLRVHHARPLRQRSRADGVGHRVLAEAGVEGGHSLLEVVVGAHAVVDEAHADTGGAFGFVRRDERDLPCLGLRAASPGRTGASPGRTGASNPS